MIKIWVLVLWISSSDGFGGAPVVVDGYTSKEICLEAARLFKSLDFAKRPQVVCLPKG